MRYSLCKIQFAKKKTAFILKIQKEIHAYWTANHYSERGGLLLWTWLLHDFFGNIINFLLPSRQNGLIFGEWITVFVKGLFVIMKSRKIINSWTDKQYQWWQLWQHKHTKVWASMLKHTPRWISCKFGTFTQNEYCTTCKQFFGSAAPFLVIAWQQHLRSTLISGMQARCSFQNGLLL